MSAPSVDQEPGERTFELRGVITMGLLGLFWVFAALTAHAMVMSYLGWGVVGFDSHAYWSAVRAVDPYAIAPGHEDAYLYSPAFLQTITPLAQFSWPVFMTCWMILSTAAFWWVLGPVPLRWRIPLLTLCLSEILYGNIHALLALMLCLGMRRPGFWAFALLTKVTIGIVGLVWFAARRDWKALGELTVVTLVVVAASALIDHQLWIAWYQFLTTTSDQEANGFRVVRMLVVVMVVFWAGRTDRAWVLPLALLWAAPRFSLFIKDLSILAATPRLWRQSSSRRRTRGATSSP